MAFCEGSMRREPLRGHQLAPCGRGQRRFNTRLALALKSRITVSGSVSSGVMTTRCTWFAMIATAMSAQLRQVDVSRNYWTRSWACCRERYTGGALSSSADAVMRPGMGGSNGVPG